MTRIDPFRDLDRLAEQLLAVGRDPRTAPMDLYKAGEHYVLHLDLPGIDPGSVDIQVDNSVLSIRAERSPRTSEELDWLVRERPSGTYLRQIKLGPGINTEAITATVEQGVLTLVMPIAEAAKPRKIGVHVTQSGIVEGGDSAQLGESATQAA